jgi:transcription antitermination factor NusG
MPYAGRWSVVLTHRSSEHRAVENLKRQDYDAFCPLIAQPSRTDLRRTVESPLFPCYVFVGIGPEKAWRSIDSTYGVVRLLTDRNPTNPKPLFVSDEKINELLTLSRTVEDPMPAGTLVRVRARRNPLYDMAGTVIEMDKLMRVSVLMSIFNRDVIVEFVDPSELEKL